MYVCLGCVLNKLIILYSNRASETNKNKVEDR